MTHSSSAAPNSAPTAKAPQASATQTEMQALAGAGRSKVILLAVVVLIALAGAAWTFLGSGGVGNPEDPGKVLLVTTDGGRKVYLQKLGFEVEAQTFGNVESKALQEVPDLEDKGVLAIMSLADRFGYGYVIFEQPYNYDFSGLDTGDTAPSFGDGDRFAVVSAGDLAAPHRVTTGMSMLTALFEQDRLAEILPPKHPPSVEAVQLRDQLREAIEVHEEGPRLQPMRFIQPPSIGSRY